MYPNKSDTTVAGDVDGDGSVSASDVTALYNYFLNGDTTHLDTSDVDGDGSVNSADLTAISIFFLEQNNCSRQILKTHKTNASTLASVMCGQVEALSLSVV